jgi:hypothetical protein
MLAETNQEQRHEVSPNTSGGRVWVGVGGVVGVGELVGGDGLLEVLLEEEAWESDRPADSDAGNAIGAIGPEEVASPLVRGGAADAHHADDLADLQNSGCVGGVRLVLHGSVLSSWPCSPVGGAERLCSTTGPTDPEPLQEFLSRGTAS